MFNVTVIRLKDIVKFIIIVSFMSILFKVVLNDLSIKNLFSKPISINPTDFIELGINTQSNLIRNIQKLETINEEQTEEVEDFNYFSLESILQIGLSTFKIKKESNVGQDEKSQDELIVATEDIKDNTQTVEATTDVTTEVVTPNPIKENYNQEYNGIKIKNETSYELTEDILNPDGLNIDTKNVLIFHTHTCESYTQSENYKYEASRKL